MADEKYIDESWKERASTEKEKPEGLILPRDHEQDEREEAGVPPADTPEDMENVEVNFLNYITSLAFQAMIFLGAVPNPITNKTEKNLKQAKFIIDTLALLKDKTAGNLNQQESEILNMSLYELQMRYVDMSSGKPELQGGE